MSAGTQAAGRGVCRACGCSPAERCAAEWRRAQGRLPDEAGARLRARYERAVEPTVTCVMVDASLCSRCHLRGVPTRGQLAELDRIEARMGGYEIVRMSADGSLILKVGDPSVARMHVVRSAL